MNWSIVTINLLTFHSLLLLFDRLVPSTCIFFPSLTLLIRHHRLLTLIFRLWLFSFSFLPFVSAFKITNNWEIIFVSQAGPIFHKVSISKAFSNCYTKVNQTGSDGDEKRVSCPRVVKLKQFLCTSADNLHCILSLGCTECVCLHMARISELSILIIFFVCLFHISPELLFLKGI